MKSDSIRTTRTRELPRTTQLPFYQYYIYAKSDGKRLMTSAVAITPEISQISPTARRSEFTDVPKLFLLWREIEEKIDHYVSYRMFFLREATKDAGD